MRHLCGVHAIRLGVALLLAHIAGHHLILADLLQRASFRLRHQERHKESQPIHRRQQPQRRLQPGIVLHVQEAERANDAASLAPRCTEPVAERAVLCRVHLCGQDERGGVRTPVGKEEREAVDGHERAVSVEVVEVASENGHEQCHEEEAHELDVTTAHVLDGGDGEPVARHGGRQGDDGLCTCSEVCLACNGHGVVGGQPADGREHGRLGEVLRVERNIQQEPARSSTQQREPVA